MRMKLFHMFLIFCLAALSLLTVYSVSPERVNAAPTTYEAENGTMSGTAKSVSCSACSGGSKVGYIGSNSENYVTMNVNALSSASYNMEIYFLVSGTRDFYISVNGATGTQQTLSGSSWSTPEKATMTVQLNAGNNTIKFYNDTVSAPDLDSIVITGSMVTAGWTEIPWDSNSYYVQNRTNAPMSERFWIVNGVYTTRVYSGEERVEMRWNNWADQNKDNMWEADVMFEPGTEKTAIMQIKSNTGGEPIYIQATSNGNIRNNGDSTNIATNMAGKWFNLKCAFNPSTGVGRIWINDVLVKTRQYNTSDREWYFKNGTYNNGISDGNYSEAHFKNIRVWRNDN
ncbi:CBM35 domain-containing protein [Paenibacillus sp. RC67]|uniref:CBM35 domain-containing protein n=1 Tax=Paenibacillus sp. RC67 TaxID=3039392 RepID=UPI0024AD96B8|nr:CBM35 domain-containing protein [Paenibacillus sp. RC67]